eukprot:gene6966-6623_t
MDETNVCSVEDPFLYRDSNGNFHAIFHNWVFHDPPVGSHAYSRDGRSWTMSESVTYNTTVFYKDGSNDTYHRRERPHLIFDDQGQPAYLTNGVVAA